MPLKGLKLGVLNEAEGIVNYIIIAGASHETHSFSINVILNIILNRLPLK